MTQRSRQHLLGRRGCTGSAGRAGSRLTTLPGVVAMLRPSSNASGSVWVSCPLARSASMCSQALEQILAARSRSSCRAPADWSAAKLVGLIASRKPRVAKRSCSFCLPSTPSSRVDAPEHMIRDQEIALADPVEQRIVAPARILKALVARMFRGFLDGLGMGRIEHALPQPDAVRPEIAGRAGSWRNRRSRGSPAGAPACGRLHRGQAHVRASSAARGPAPRSSAGVSSRLGAGGAVESDVGHGVLCPDFRRYEPRY